MFWHRPFLRLVMAGVLGAALGTALDALIGGGAVLGSGLPQAFLATLPFFASPLRRRTSKGLAAAQDRIGLACVVLLGVLEAGFGVVRVVTGDSSGQRVIAGVVVGLGVACVVLAAAVLSRPRRGAREGRLS
ncbi:hypothetical protein JL107_07095 [Nakamurella flavida]|uniref:Uncharacterized protein n=1 Tax=Nakamurella flavida TaxID=363630 RepID=A0A939C5H8_9ACTN|nr:hypothetical protein [Nakamurella flavida]MBM9476207.1 hypothetical protein [Nakamurella flavida]MDP9779695.1 hypothetical protein [Nakamurella flavida]